MISGNHLMNLRTAQQIFGKSSAKLLATIFQTFMMSMAMDALGMTSMLRVVDIMTTMISSQVRSVVRVVAVWMVAQTASASQTDLALKKFVNLWLSLKKSQPALIKRVSVTGVQRRSTFAQPLTRFLMMIPSQLLTSQITSTR